jgi:hypothetical protein
MYTSDKCQSAINRHWNVRRPSGSWIVYPRTRNFYFEEIIDGLHRRAYRTSTFDLATLSRLTWRSACRKLDRFVLGNCFEIRNRGAPLPPCTPVLSAETIVRGLAVEWPRSAPENPVICHRWSARCSAPRTSSRCDVEFAVTLTDILLLYCG